MVEKVRKRFSKITERFRSRFYEGEFLVGVEVDPPRGNSLDDVFPALKKLVHSGVDFFGASDNPMARYRLSPVVSAFLIKDRLSVETMFHFTCRDRNLIGIHSSLLGASAIGVNMILALHGDSPEKGDLPGSKGVFDADANKLVQISSAFNEGKDINGNAIEGRTDFLIGVAFNPNANNFEFEVNKLRYRMEIGARFSITQPVYSKVELERIETAVEKTGMKIFVGIMPIISYKNGTFLNENVPGIFVPDEILSKFKGLSKEDAREVSVDIFSDFISFVKERGFHGVYIMPPLENYNLVKDILKRAL